MNCMSNSCYGQLKKKPLIGKNPFVALAPSVWYVKIDHTQNIDLSTSLEMPYKELLNALFSFEICHS